VLPSLTSWILVNSPLTGPDKVMVVTAGVDDPWVQVGTHPKMSEVPTGPRLHWSDWRPPPAPRPPSPPTLERLRRGNTVITTNYSRRSCVRIAVSPAGGETT
jgi:hypothetical protein